MSRLRQAADTRGLRRRTVSCDADTELALRWLRRNGVAASVILREGAARTLADFGCAVWGGEVVTHAEYRRRADAAFEARLAG